MGDLSLFHTHDTDVQLYTVSKTLDPAGILLY